LGFEYKNLAFCRNNGQLIENTTLVHSNLQEMFFISHQQSRNLPPENFQKYSSTTPEKFQKNSSATPET
jgi:hypothetical protein